MRVPGEVEGDAEALAAGDAVAAGEALAAGEGDAFFFAASAVDATARLRTMIEEMPKAISVRFIQLVCGLSEVGWVVEARRLVLLDWSSNSTSGMQSPCLRQFVSKSKNARTEK